MTRRQPVSRRHHVIPVMLLQHFVDPSGRLWVADRDRGLVYFSTPHNAFVQKDLYNTRSYPDRSADSAGEEPLRATVLSDEHERHLSRIESAAAPIIEDIIEAARNGICPRLSGTAGESFKRFLLAMGRRTPEAQRRVSRGRGTPDLVYDVVRDFMHKEGTRGLPSRDQFLSDPAMREYADVVLANSDARFAAGIHPIVQEAEAAFCREVSLLIAVISEPKRSFVVGSQGVTIVRSNGFDRQPESWLPIAADVAVQPRYSEEAVGLVAFGRRDDHLIRRINQATTAGSRMIAGRSEKLVRSLTRATGGRSSMR